MNRIDKVAFNRRLGLWQVAGETACSGGKDDKRRAGAFMVACLLALPGATLANPKGGQVVAGSVSIGGSGHTVEVNQSSQRAIVNWQSFSIGAGEQARFNLPNAQAAILNRVTGGDPSSIHGRLSSNGRIFLINPNGVVIGPSGKVETTGFIASTRDVSSERFMAGKSLNFIGDSTAKVQNLGTIDASNGDVLLIGARVENAGTVNARQGVAALLAGNEVLYAPDADSRIVIRSGVDASAATAGVDNSGVIRAAQAELQAVGGNPWTLAVNHGGVIDVSNVKNVGGRVLITGPNVQIGSNAVIDASGERGGGDILIGGDYQGKNAAVQNAQTTVVQKGAQIKVDALGAGDGGKVIVWADGKTTYQGMISARGGATGGDGGFAEVSGKNVLDFRGTADLRAPRGKTGTLLLDPTDITIGLAANRPSGGDTADRSWVAKEDLEAALGTANVIVSTKSSGQGHGDITIDSSMNGQSIHTAGIYTVLTLQAQRDILIDNDFRVTGFARLDLEAGRNIAVGANKTLTGGLGGLTLAAGLADANGGIQAGTGSSVNMDYTPTEYDAYDFDNDGGVYKGGMRFFVPGAAKVSGLDAWVDSFKAIETHIGDKRFFHDTAYSSTGPGLDSAGFYYYPADYLDRGDSPQDHLPDISTSNGNVSQNGGLPAGTSGTVYVYDGPVFNSGPFGAGFDFLTGERLLSESDIRAEINKMIAAGRTKDVQFEAQRPVYPPVSLFSDEVEKSLSLYLAVYTQPPATPKDLGIALAALYEGLKNKPNRTELENKQLHELTFAILAAQEYVEMASTGLPGLRFNETVLSGQLENKKAELAQAIADRERLPEKTTNVNLGTLFGGTDPVAQKIEEADRKIESLQQSVDSLQSELKENRSQQRAAREGNTATWLTGYILWRQALEANKGSNSFF